MSDSSHDTDISVCAVCKAPIEIRHVHSSIFGRVDTCNGPKCIAAVAEDLEHAAAVEARKAAKDRK